jgi:putative sigma-54 modulation protein
MLRASPTNGVLMEIVVRGKNVKVAPALSETTREKLGRFERFNLKTTRVEVDYSEIRNPRVHDKELCEVTVHLKGHFVKAHAASTDPSAALDLVIDKVEHQLTRLKDKKVDRSHPRRRRLAPPPPLEEWEEAEAPAAGEGVAVVANGAGTAEIVRTKQFAAKPMGLDEAALQMDLLGHDFYLFTNAESGRAAVLYRRRDGHLGLIEAVG